MGYSCMKSKNPHQSRQDAAFLMRSKGGKAKAAKMSKAQRKALGQFLTLARQKARKRRQAAQ